MFDMKKVIIVREVLVNGEVMEQEFIMTSDTLPMAKHHADMWAKRHGYKLVKSPKKQAEMFNPCRVAVSKNEVIFYAIR